VALLAAGCGGHSGVSVSPRASLDTAKVDIRVTGLAPLENATITLTSRDVTGRAWSSHAVFEANKHGNIDVAQAPSQSGSYKGIWKMGLIAAMQPVQKVNGDAAYLWGQKQTFDVDVRQGLRTFTSSFERGVPSVLAAKLSLVQNGFIGEYYAPVHATHKPALLVFGGSEGGLRSRYIAANLAANGYPALAIAYFGLPGLPPILADVPLEYFERALRWLDTQPGVDPKHVFTLGVSRGSEAAQLLGVHFPNLVHGVVAVVPSDIVNCSYPSCDRSAWTLEAVPLPFERFFGNVLPTDEPTAQIRDTKIHGPILFLCAAHDELWPSCDYSGVAMETLKGFAYPHELIEANGGHGVGSLVPYDPSTAETNAAEKRDERARAAIWPQVLEFLARNG
jgi:dienelactone hydrolase